MGDTVVISKADFEREVELELELFASWMIIEQVRESFAGEKSKTGMEYVRRYLETKKTEK